MGSLWGNPLAAEQNGSEHQVTTGAFNGAYVGLGLGAASGSGMSEYPVLAGGTTYEPFDPNSGKAISGFIGYNFQRGNLVYGAELQYANLVGLLEERDSRSEVTEVMSVADLRGRIGYVVGDAMFYGALGWSAGKFRVHPGTGFGNRENQTFLQGASLSAGMEYNFHTRWFASGEITYRDLRGSFSEASRDTKLDLSTFTLRLAYRF